MDERGITSKRNSTNRKEEGTKNHMRVRKRLPEEALGRIWSHVLSEEDVFNERVNHFMLAQSILLAAYIALLSNLETTYNVVFVFAGLSFSLLFLLINHRQLLHIEVTVDIAATFCYEYKEYVLTHPKRHTTYSRIVLALLAYAPPLVMASLWLFLLVATLKPI